MVRRLRKCPRRSSSCKASCCAAPVVTGRWAEILALVLQHDEQAVLCAVELALEAGVATKTHVLNVLYRLADGNAPPSPIDAPEALRLAQEPLANVQRYDGLRDGGLRRAS